VFDPVEVRHVWEEHLRGYSNNVATLWPVLMFDAWAEAADDASEVATLRSTTVAEQFGRATGVMER
jgi:hypothetical protein